MKEIRVIAFITNNVIDKAGQIPETYLSSETEMPNELITEMRLNGAFK
jgi:hypothetical protein